MRGDLELAGAIILQRDLRWIDLNAFNAGVGITWAGRARGDPFGDNLEFRRVHLKDLAALVLHQSGGLEQHQAATRVAGVDASP